MSSVRYVIVEIPSAEEDSPRPKPFYDESELTDAVRTVRAMNRNGANVQLVRVEVTGQGDPVAQPVTLTDRDTA
jgi:hypothetical protein